MSKGVTTTAVPGVANCVVEAHEDVAEQHYVSQDRCVNWLLDCLNAAVRPSVKAIVRERLADISRVGLVTGTDFRAALDQIAMAAMVDQAFDHLEIPSA